MLTPTEAAELDLVPDNPELLQYAAKMGNNETVDVRRLAQIVISQHGVNLTFNCSLILPMNPSPQTEIMWWRKRPGIYE